MHPGCEQRRGFTLIELLVVVIIISILASIAMPQYFRLVERARVTEITSMLAVIRSAQERALAQNGNYIRTNQDVAGFDINFPGNDPTYGMKYYFMMLGQGSPAGCQAGTPFYNVMFIRITNNAGVNPQYFKNYSLLYERCVDRFTWPGCPNCALDFR